MTSAQIADLQKGMESDPMYASEQLYWLTDEGWRLYHERNKTSDFYAKEVRCINTACENIQKELPLKLLIIDVGAGDVNNKSIAMLKQLLGSNKERSICYIALDISENVNNWNQLREKMLDLGAQVLKIVTIVGDMVEIMDNIDSYIPPEYSTWPVLFTCFGPNPMNLPHRVYISGFEKICEVINKKNGGWYIVTYLQLNENTEEKVTKYVFNTIDMTGYLRAILLGFNKLADADLDLTAFEYKTRFAEHFSTPGVSGHWSGAVYYAQAIRDVTFTSAVLNTTKTIKKGSIIRLSEDQVKSHYYSSEYFRSIGEKHGLKFKQEWPESSGLLYCMVYHN